MIFRSEHMTEVSGSIAGVTYSRAKGGVLYRRARAIPVNPATSFQGQVRNALTELVTRWVENLTSVQRTSWDTYGANVLVTNAIGQVVALSGQNWYIGSNTPRLQAEVKLPAFFPLPGGTTIVDSAPTLFDRGDFTSPTVGVVSATTGIAFTITVSDDWAVEDGAMMLVFQGRPRNASRTFFAGPYRLVNIIPGDSVIPSPSQPIPIVSLNANGFPITEGQVIDLVVVVSRLDGRLSTRRTLGSFPVAA